MLYTRHTSLLQMKKSFLCILCTAYCNIIMPQIDNNVDNICNTVIMEVVIICMKSSLKKKINNSTCQPFSSHNHYFPNNHPDNNKLGCLKSLEDSKQLNSNKKKRKKKGPRRSVRTFLSVPSHSCAHVAFCLITHFSVGRKIHTYDI